MADTKRKIVLRFYVIFAFALLAAGLIVAKIVKIQFVEGEQWRELGKQNKREDITVYANRGNIYSADGDLLASSIPYYKLFMDFTVGPLDSLFYRNLDSLAICLSRKIGDKPRAQYKKELEDAFKKSREKKPNRRYLLTKKEVSYIDLQEIKKFPLFRHGSNKSGFYTEERFKRIKPFGQLASRTIGSIMASSGKGFSGIERSFEEYLQGKNGVCTRKRVGGERIAVNEIDPVDGIDIVTTLDMNIQDVAEHALEAELKRLNAAQGCAVVMEVHSGEIKAIANLVRDTTTGRYAESANVAFSSMREPGSTFKTASMIVALEDGYVAPDDTVDTKNGVFYFYDSAMKDHNYKNGGYQILTATEVIQKSSNIGISRLIDKYYGKNPETFVNRLYDMKLNQELEFDIPGAGKPRIPHPKDKSFRWNGTTLPWMTIGYNVVIPPIYTLMFYNAIANDGCMIKPFIVKRISRNGETVKTFSAETVCHSICSKSTLRKIRPMLESVVGQGGTAIQAGSAAFRVAGKTGTAQINYSNRKSGNLRHQLSFCGYFPAEKPLYTCIVTIMEPRTTSVSAGAMAGGVFKIIAEKVYASTMSVPTDSIKRKDETLKTPVSKNGTYRDMHTVLSELDVKTIVNKRETAKDDWVRASAGDDGVRLEKTKFSENIVPNVVGMGARDAVYILESRGLSVQLQGKGSVRHQSIPAGGQIVKGRTIFLQLR